MGHQCESIMFHCMDFRLVERTRGWMKEQGYLGDCDVVALAGAAKELVDGSAGAKELLLKQIAISIKLHQASRVILVHHTTCGAYAQAYAFNTIDDEIAQQHQDLTKAEKIIKLEFPELEIVKVIAKMNDAEGIDVEFCELA